MRKLKLILGMFLVAMLSFTSAFPQAESDEYLNEKSVAPIPGYDHLFKVTVWRRIDLKEKQNKGFFAKNNELSTILINAVNNDLITTIYAKDSLDREITKEEFISNQKQYADQEVIEYDPWEVDYAFYEGDLVTYNGKNYESLLDDNLGNTPDQEPDFWREEEVFEDIYFPTDISLIQIKEDMIFDKRRSRLYYDIQSVELFVPGDVAVEGVNKSIGVFAYKDLEKFFRENEEVSVWYNQYNSAENKNLADAFLLRLFRGSLYKVENPDDLDISAMYGSGKAGLFAAEWLEMQIMEREHNLWSY